MPHVITQWQGGDLPNSLGIMKGGQTTAAQHRRSFSSLPMAKQSQNRSGRGIPNLTLQTAESFYRNAASPESLGQESPVPVTTVQDPSFKSPSRSNWDSLSVNPPFIELEDTSQCVVRSKPPPVKGTKISFKTSKPLSRAIVVALDESIAALEAESQELLKRALAAEKVAKENEQLQNRINAAEKTARELREQNRALQHEIGLYTSKQLPKSSPLQEKCINSTPMSTFNPSTLSSRIDNFPQEASSNMLTPISYHPILESNQCVRRRLPRPSQRPAIPSEFRNFPPTPATSNFAVSPQSAYRSQPLSPTPNTYISAISSPLPGSVTRNNVMLDGVSLSTQPAGSIVSLAEAYRRNKPLPPLRQRSISIPTGVVEIGYGGSREMEQPKREKAFHNPFRKGKRKKKCSYCNS
ncbi:hypothetical protein F5884DRAFT_848801 [Xylogone sp. PMI_703]|nr:hypothetical protein F5884DRAFT_848801 [Xylogone sp. PMI_703]